MDSDPKNYELAYLLSPSIPEEEAVSEAGKLTLAIEEGHGVVHRAENPRKRRLAYPVKKEKTAYFGWISFSIAPPQILALEKRIGEIPLLLRRMVIERAPEELRVPFFPEGGTRRRARPEEAEPAKPEEKLDLEALDKKLEEILGK